ncbi:MAG: 3'(2'),5'-bisphosphate nucleotidase CysQ [Candidatus Cloacimonetes bacterium]|nr:3'(2'),5'-bisphosphate nucleotidase CysQ [Candidatus Cloacimonadota bacterium]MCF8266054.1 3'(2'),5'-bisphosphate nucleotidase CysQ [Melioribacteraceae bacterium]MCF8315120.1 3'(2'),5'-bisphosphate nucleotidase CysQ [Ignavibacteriales bacterium]MCF8435884.1 3'(2'),5'-bisphosphate nucleotidase CysQ [Ignavibacteriales bacterium]
MLEELIGIAIEAGRAVLEIYTSDTFFVKEKSDKSPLTLADEKSHDIIYKRLTAVFPDIPVISEEGKDIAYDLRKGYERFFLVDPLDGTKEFVNKNGEFTINIALIENNLPVAGVIYIPVSNETYYGSVHLGSFKIDSAGIVSPINVSSKSIDDELDVVQSRSHSGEEESRFYSKYRVRNKLSKGSSLKICLVAEGKADLYFRSGPTYEWDIAAGHAILLGANGFFVTKDYEKQNYNKPALLNTGFVASSFPVTGLK